MAVSKRCTCGKPVEALAGVVNVHKQSCLLVATDNEKHYFMCWCVNVCL